MGRSFFLILIFLVAGCVETRPERPVQAVAPIDESAPVDTPPEADPPQPAIAPIPRQNSPHSLSKSEIAVVEAGVRRVLKDPESARFGDMIASASQDKVVTVCGMVNAKNSYGGYTGERPYLGAIAHGTKGAVFIVVKMGSSESDARAVLAVCGQKGIFL